MRRKIIIVLLIALLVITGGLVAFWPFHNRHVLRLPGVVEVQEVRLGSKVGGRVDRVLIKEGRVINYKDELIIFEAPELRNQRQQVKAKLDSAKAELERLRASRPEEIKAAAAAMESAKAKWDRAVNGWKMEEKQQTSELKVAEADLDKAEREWDRVRPLFEKEKAIAKAEYDAAKTGFDAATAKKQMMHWRNEWTRAVRPQDITDANREYQRLTAQRQQLELTQQPDLDILKAKVAELQANLDAIDINLAETTIFAPPHLGKAVVEVLSVRPGDLVQPNQPVIRCLRVQDLWVKVYVPETQYGLVTLRQKVDVTIDSHPGRIFKGVVEQRANISEFTPRNVQSMDERRHQVFGVKIRVDDPDGVFNAGMAAEVTFPLE
jgi:multidrug resistance efflux pump